MLRAGQSCTMLASCMISTGYENTDGDGGSTLSLGELNGNISGALNGHDG